MPKSWFGLKIKSLVFVLGVVLAAAWAFTAPVGAAVVEQWDHDLDISRDQILETVSWRVLMEDLDDVEAWSEFPVYLDEHRELVSAEAWVVSPEGQRRRLKRKEKDLRDVTSSWELSSSRRLLVFEPDQLLPGGRLEVKAQIRETPYYPGAAVRLRPVDEAFESFKVSVRLAPDVEGFRYRFHGPLRDAPPEETSLDGSPSPSSTDASEARGNEAVAGSSGAEYQETDDGLRISGNWARRPWIPELAADTEVDPVLFMAWDSAPTWDGVGRWYRGILAGLPATGTGVRTKASGLLADVESGSQASPEARRAELEALVSFVRSKVRYVAVQVGIGGYRPSPSAETLERKWGDCKDKSFLLIDFLREAGIEAFPALIRLGEDGRIVDDFPLPFGFNHLIVAVQVEGLAVSEGDPIADGFLFIDPTQTTGSAAYLHQAVQDQSALVVLPTEGRMVRTPILPASQSVDLEVELDVEPSGFARGTCRLRFRGDYGSDFSQSMTSRPPKEFEDQLRSLVRRLLPGSDVPRVSWSGATEGFPTFEVNAEVTFETLIEGRGRSAKLDGFQWTPEPASLEELAGFATALPAAEVRNRFVLRFPEELCPPKERLDELDGSAGSFTHRITSEPGKVVVERTTLAKKSWFTEQDLPDLMGLALEEHRAPKRRIRFRCR